MPIIHSIYNRPDTFETSISDVGESLTQQQFFDETDTYAIIDKYKILGTFPNSRPPSSYTYGDFSDVSDLRESLEHFTNLQQQFLELPSGLRRDFGDDPLNYAEYLNRLYLGTASELDLQRASTYGISYDSSKYVKEEVPPVSTPVSSVPEQLSVVPTDGIVNPSPST